MQCIFCGNKTSVTNSRKSGSLNVWRRRKCNSCDTLFTSVEKPNLDNSLKVNNGSKKTVPYSRGKLTLSIYNACDHLIDKQALRITYTVDSVEVAMLRHAQDNQVHKRDLMAAVASVLQHLDSVAYIKYCSAHNIKPDTKTIKQLT